MHERDRAPNDEPSPAGAQLPSFASNAEHEPSALPRIGVLLGSADAVLELTPGQPTVVQVALTNHGDFADVLSVTVAGQPGAWITILRPTIAHSKIKHEIVGRQGYRKVIRPHRYQGKGERHAATRLN